LGNDGKIIRRWSCRSLGHQLNVERSDLGKDLFEMSAKGSHLPEDAREQAALPFIYVLL